MKKVTCWMAAAAMAAMPLMAQEGQPSEEEKKQVEQTIDEAIGEDEQWVEESWEEEPEPVKEEPQRDPYDRRHREIQTLMHGSGGYGSLSFGYSEINYQPSIIMGARGAWVLGHSLALGVAGVGFTSDFTPVGADYYALAGGYGGMLIEPIILGWLPVHISLPLVIGGGGVASYSTTGDLWNYDSFEPYFGEYDAFFVAEAGVELEFNLVRFFRLSLFGNYRWTTDLEMKPMYGLGDPSPYPVRTDALHGWSAGMRFKFGSF